ncbi:MAG: glycosyltransferase family 39 protein [Nitrospinaceae bacterium]
MLLFAYHLDAVPPYHADENFYVESTKNMLESGDYITPIYHQKKRFAKPVLFYWMVAASYKMFGVNLFSARLVSAVFGALCIPLLYLLARRMFNRQIALMSSFILPGFYLHFQIARWAITDMALNFFVLMSIFFFVRGTQEEPVRRRDFYLFYLSMALGFMIKGPPAVLIPALAAGLFLLITRDRTMFSQLRLFSGTLIFLAVTLPWFLIMWSLHGDAFKNHILGPELKDRIVHGMPFSFYFLGVLFRYYLPWALFIVSAAAIHLGLASWSPEKSEETKTLWEKIKSGLLKLLEQEQRPVLFCFLWIFGPLLLFTLFRIEHSRYMLPCSPAIAMILAHFFYKFEESGNDLNRRLFKIPFILTVLFYIVVALVVCLAILVFNKTFTVPLPLLVLPFFLTFGASLLGHFFMRDQIKRLIYTLAVFQVLFLASVSGDVLPFFNRYPMKAFAEEILKSGTGNEPVVVYRLGNHRPRLGILTGHMVFLYSAPQEVNHFIDTHENFFLAMRETDWQETFMDAPLFQISTDKIWKKSRIDSKKLLRFWEEGPGDLNAHMENIVLLTNRKP